MNHLPNNIGGVLIHFAVDNLEWDHVFYLISAIGSQRTFLGVEYDLNVYYGITAIILLQKSVS